MWPCSDSPGYKLLNKRPEVVGPLFYLKYLFFSLKYYIIYLENDYEDRKAAIATKVFCNEMWECRPTVIIYAPVVELADTPVLEAGAKAYRFKSCREYQLAKG